MNATSWVQKQFRKVLPPPQALVAILDQKTAEGLWEKKDRPSTLWAMYVQESWVRAAIDTIKKSVLADGWHLVPTKDNPDQEQFRKAMMLLEAPNDQDTLEDLMDDTIVDLMVFGDSFWEKGRWEDSGELAAIYSLDTVRMSIRADDHGNIEGYLQKRFEETVTMEPIEFEPRNIIHFKLNARGRNIFGLSPLQSLLRPVEADIWAQNYNRAFYRNNATPRRLFTVPQYTPPDTVALITQQLTKFKGAENAHRDVVLVGDVKTEPLATEPKDMEFLQQRQFSRDEIMAVLGVPPGLLSIIETGNIGAGSGEFQRETFQKGTVKPMKRKLEGKLNREILLEELKITDWLFRFMAPDPSEDLNRAKTFDIYLKNGTLDIPEVRKELGKPAKKAVKQAATAVATRKVQPAEIVEETDDKTKSFALNQPTVGEDPAPFIQGLKPVANKIKRGMLGVLGKWKMRVLARIDREIADQNKSESRDIEKQLQTDAFAADVSDNEMRVVIEAGLGSGARLGINTAAGLGGASVDTAFAAVAPLLSARAQGIATDLGEEVRNSVTDLILTGTREGKPIPEIKKDISVYFDRPRSFEVKDVVDDEGVVIRKGHTRTITPGHWAEMTARSEANFAASQASLESYKQAGIKQVRWKTAAFGVDPVLCRPFNNDIFTLDEAAGRIPAHHVCLLPGQEILAPDAISGSKSLYEGRCVEVRLANGSKITVTENHPILTAEGWTFAKCIKPGDQVFHAPDAQRIAAAINQNDDHVPTLIEDKFKALQKTPGMKTRTMKTSAEDFHGDGRNLNGNVDVVGSDSLLGNARDVPAIEFGNKGGLDRALMAEGKLAALRHPLNRLDGFGLSSDSIMGRSGQSESGLLAHSAHSQSVGLANGSRFDSRNDKTITKGTAADPRLAREFLLRFSGQVTLQEVSQVRYFNTKSWVFDLHCKSYELYSCNGIIVKNCRCRWIPVVPTEAEPIPLLV